MTEEEKRKRFQESIRPEVKELLTQEQITYEDLQLLRENMVTDLRPEEMRLLLPYLDTEGLIKYTEAITPMSAFHEELSEFDIPKTIDSSIINIILPLFIARIRTYDNMKVRPGMGGKIKLKDNRNTKTKLKHRNKAQGDFHEN